MAGQTSCCTYVGPTYIGQTYVGRTSIGGCGVAHMVAQTTPVQEDLGSILHPNQGWHFRKLSSPFLQTTDLKTISFICYIVMSS
jgi:hypothetical protein